MSIVAYKFYKGFQKIKRIVNCPDPKKIKRVNFAITYLCNSRCISCSIWKKYHKKATSANQELNLEQIKEFFNQSKFFGNLDEINLTGGEPFLRKDFRDIYQYLRRRFPRLTISICTNGLKVINNWLEKKEDSIWTVMVFSLDGLQEKNDLIRGIKGSYKRVINTIGYYKDRYPSLRMALSFTILPENYNELIKVFELSRKLRLAFTMRFGCESENYYDNSETKFQWTNEMLNKVEKDVQMINKEMSFSLDSLNRLLNPNLYFFSQMISYQREKKRLFHCYSGTHSLFIDPYGNIFPCIFLDKPLGSIVKESFDDLWFSINAARQRLYIEKGNCHCWVECETIPSLQRKWNFTKYR
jgi:MoaA/NifB/PqqE/SkfB family radical SAM enzyme